MQTITEFSQLSHIEVGGTKGKVLSTSVQQVYADFQTAVNAIRVANLDVMDVDAHSFDSEFYKWRCSVKVHMRDHSLLSSSSCVVFIVMCRGHFDCVVERVQELERRLASVIQQGFDDSSTIWGQFKLLDSFHGLLSRPIVAVGAPLRLSRRCARWARKLKNGAAAIASFAPISFYAV